MFSQLAPIGLCEEMTSLRPHEILIGAVPCGRHERLLQKYLQARSRAAARTLIVADIREALRAGAPRRAVDLAIVLRQLLALDQGRGVETARAFPAARRRGTPPRLRQSWRFAGTTSEAPVSQGASAEILWLPVRRTGE
jgi:hypothetical protein